MGFIEMDAALAKLVGLVSAKRAVALVDDRAIWGAGVDQSMGVKYGARIPNSPGSISCGEIRYYSTTQSSRC